MRCGRRALVFVRLGDFAVFNQSVGHFNHSLLDGNGGDAQDVLQLVWKELTRNQDRNVEETVVIATTTTKKTSHVDYEKIDLTIGSFQIQHDMYCVEHY